MDNLKNKLTFMFPMFNLLAEDEVDLEEFALILHTFVSGFRHFTNFPPVQASDLKRLTIDYFNIIDNDFSGTLDVEEVRSNLSNMPSFERLFSKYEGNYKNYSKQYLIAPITDFII